MVETEGPGGLPAHWQISRRVSKLAALKDNIHTAFDELELVGIIDCSSGLHADDSILRLILHICIAVGKSSGTQESILSAVYVIMLPYRHMVEVEEVLNMVGSSSSSSSRRRLSPVYAGNLL